MQRPHPLHRNRRSEDITQQNFPYTYSTIRRALRYHDESGENVFHDRRPDEVRDPVSLRRFVHGHEHRLLRDPTELFNVAASLKKEVFLVADPGGDKRFASAGFMGALKKHRLPSRLIANEQYLNEIPFEGTAWRTRGRGPCSSP